MVKSLLHSKPGSRGFILWGCGQLNFVKCLTGAQHKECVKLQPIPRPKITTNMITTQVKEYASQGVRLYEHRLSCLDPAGRPDVSCQALSESAACRSTGRICSSCKSARAAPPALPPDSTSLADGSSK